MKKIFVSGILTLLMLVAYLPAYCWGFWAHQKINYFAVFSLPPEMMVLFKPNITFISEHAVDPDKGATPLPAKDQGIILILTIGENTLMIHFRGNGKMPWQNIRWTVLPLMVLYPGMYR